MSERYKELLGNAILGIDTLWGGDVMCPFRGWTVHRRFVVFQ